MNKDKEKTYIVGIMVGLLIAFLPWWLGLIVVIGLVSMIWMRKDDPSAKA